MKIHLKLVIGYVAIALLTCGVGYLGIREMSLVPRSFDVAARDVLPASRALETLHYAGLRVVSSLSQYEILAELKHGGLEAEKKRAQKAEKLAASLRSFRNALSRCESLVHQFPPAQKRAFRGIRSSGEELQRISNQMLAQIPSESSEADLHPLKRQLVRTETNFLGAIQQTLHRETITLVESRRGVERAVATARDALFLISGLIFFIIILAGLLISKSISAPLNRLKTAAEQINHGGLEPPIDFVSRGEFGVLGTALSNMARELRASKTEILSANHYLNNIMNSMADSLIVTSLDGRIRSVNRATCILLGYREEELIDRPLDVIMNGPVFRDLLAGGLRAGKSITNIEETYRSQSGQNIPVALSGAVLQDHQGEVGGAVFLAQNMTDRRRAEREIQRLAFFDSLTGLPNRRLFRDQLDQVLAQAQHDGSQVALLFLDLDRFKDVNDTLGHATGDRLIQVVAARLETRIRKSDILVRFGGDEFVLLVTVQDEQDVVEMAGEILELMASPFGLEGREMVISVSIGIVFYPVDGMSGETLLKHADMAMYAAKGKGGNRFEFFSAEMNQKALERRDLESSLRRGLKQGEFFLHYQPQFDLKTGKISGVEALVRWQDPEKGLILPGKFIGVAEETGLIRPLGEWVLRTACAQNKAWQEAGYPPIRLAVNISGDQFKQPDFVRMVESVLAETDLAPHFLELELTESILMEGASSSIATLLDLKVRGIHLAIDDFGTGYSSLSYLKHFPINRLKIDQSFVSDIHCDKDDAAIVEAILAMAHSLGLQVVAEGVENGEEIEFLKARRCDEVQGYYCAVPLAPEDVVPYFGEPGKVLSLSRSAPSTIRSGLRRL